MATATLKANSTRKHSTKSATVSHGRNCHRRRFPIFVAVVTEPGGSSPFYPRVEPFIDKADAREYARDINSCFDSFGLKARVRKATVVLLD